MHIKDQSKTWWKATKASPAKLTYWLQRQYVGEFRAHERLNQFLDQYDVSPAIATVVKVIAKQEAKHGRWVGKLLENRNIKPLAVHEDRYWKKTLKGIKSFDDVCGVAWAAENMRLARIETIAEDKSAPKDIRATFKKILNEEKFHAKAFGAFASPLAKTQALAKHKKGMRAIGLEA